MEDISRLPSILQPLLQVPGLRSHLGGLGLQGVTLPHHPAKVPLELLDPPRQLDGVLLSLDSHDGQV